MRGRNARHGRKTMSAPAEPSVAQRFQKLAKQWQKETVYLSVIEQMTDHPAYREIVALGWPVVPFLLADLQRQPNHWFPALAAITGENPVPEEDAGKRGGDGRRLDQVGHAQRDPRTRNPPVTKRRILKKKIMRVFPGLTASNFQVKSRRTQQYNCIALTAGFSNQWWDPDEGYFWPPGLPRNTNLSTAIAVFQWLGFEECDGPALEQGWDKIAIYGKVVGNRTVYTHAARQLENGKWISKLGRWYDIHHDTPEAVACVAYGTVAKVLKRTHGQPDRF